MPYWMFLFVCAVWGSNFILMKKAAVAFSPLSIGAWRLIGGAIPLALFWLLHRRTGHWRASHVRALLIVVLIGYAWPYAIQPLLVARHGSGFIGMTVSFVPLLTILVSVPVLGTWPTWRQAVGVLGGLACMGLLMRDGLDRQVPWTDLGLAFTVPLCYAIANTLIRRELRDVSSLAVTLAALLAGAAMLLPLVPVVPLGPLDPAPDRHEQLVALASLVCLGVLGTGLATVVFNKLVQDQGPLFAGMVTYLVPVGAVIFGWLDHERTSLLQLIALGGVLVMVAVVQYKGAVGPTRRPAAAQQP